MKANVPEIRDRFWSLSWGCRREGCEASAASTGPPGRPGGSAALCPRRAGERSCWGPCQWGCGPNFRLHCLPSCLFSWAEPRGLLRCVRGTSGVGDVFVVFSVCRVSVVLTVLCDLCVALCHGLYACTQYPVSSDLSKRRPQHRCS